VYPAHIAAVALAPTPNTPVDPPGYGAQFHRFYRCSPDRPLQVHRIKGPCAWSCCKASRSLRDQATLGWKRQWLIGLPWENRTTRWALCRDMFQCIQNDAVRVYKHDIGLLSLQGVIKHSWADSPGRCHQRSTRHARRAAPSCHTTAWVRCARKNAAKRGGCGGLRKRAVVRLKRGSVTCVSSKRRSWCRQVATGGHQGLSETL
jgi:hypothetical protein